MQVKVQQAKDADIPIVATMVGELLSEIMTTIGVAAFQFDLAQTQKRLSDFLQHKPYYVWVARNEAGDAIGFLTAYESYALYAEGAFGTITELYVKPAYRSFGVGQLLLEEVKAFGKTQSWTRLEVTTPPLPAFDKALGFYEREGFEITGGRKLKVLLTE